MGHRGTNIANGILSFLALASGIIIAVLISVLFSKTIQLAQESGVEYPTLSTYFWAVGFVYIIPGFIGVIAAGVRKKGLYIAQMVLMIICLISMAVAFYFAFAIVVFLVASQRPVCSGPSCPLIKLIYNVSLTIASFLVIGWVMSLAATITGGILACRREDIDAQPGANTTFIQMGPPYHPGQPYPDPKNAYYPAHQGPYIDERTHGGQPRPY